MSRDKWVDFFTEARIPLGAAKQYAKAFDDNRISTDMLMDLNKVITVIIMQNQRIFLY